MATANDSTTLRHGASALVLILDPFLASSLTLSSSCCGEIQEDVVFLLGTARGWGNVFTDVPRTRVRCRLLGRGRGDREMKDCPSPCFFVIRLHLISCLFLFLC
uniref:Putative secreted protein n=1 Tax=Amblyomma cajennense TaxID=34607 RepID=A0A023FBN3_AMBCJ